MEKKLILIGEGRVIQFYKHNLGVRPALVLIGMFLEGNRDN